MVLESFIAMTNSKFLVMIIPAVFMLLISDFPKTDGNTMFYILKTVGVQLSLHMGKNFLPKKNQE